MELFLEIAVEAFLDSLKMLPFLFGAYWFMEWLEHASGERMERTLAGARRLGPVTGALLGCIPQCGFSVAAANLYAGRVISLGTLVAVFLSTSDEAVPLFLGAPGQAGVLVPLLGLKVVTGALAGLVIDRLRGRRDLTREEIHGLCGHCGCGEGGILPAALRHTGSIFLFILLVNLLLGWGVETLGEERLSVLLLSQSLLQPLAAALLGLIPNCASSVLLTRLYLTGAVSFASLAAGLSAASGVGMLVLWRANPRPRENLRVLGLVWGVGAGVGMLLQAACHLGA